MAGFIGPLIVGIICVILGISNMQGNISSLHFYHRHRVSEEDRIPFGKKIGLGTMMIGIGMLMFSGLSAATFFTENSVFILVGSAILIVGIAAGLTMSLHAMFKYNKGIF